MVDNIGSAGGNELPDRRLTPRRPLALRVSLYYDRLGLVTCKTRNLGLQGVLLDTGRVSLNSGARVELVITDTAAGQGDSIRILANVCRATDSLAALNFFNLEVGSYRRLKTMLAGNSANH